MSIAVPWGKWDTSLPQPYPAQAHLLDTAAVALIMWRSVLSGPVRELLSKSLDPQPDLAARRFALVAGSHDLGKLGPLHQGQLLSQRWPEFSAFLSDLDLPVPSTEWLTRATAAAGAGTPLRAYFRHEALSGHVLQRSGAQPWLSAAVSGHHGRFLPDLDRVPRLLDEHHRLLDATDWADQQDSALAALRVALALSVNALSPALSKARGPLIPLLTGLICLADWLASDDAFLLHDHLPLLETPGEYLAKRVVDAEAHVEECLGAPVTRSGSFTELFGFDPDRPAQEWVTSVDHGPGLMVVTVPVAEGKTETALWRHCARPDLRDGLLFALPTTAMADAMLTRILEFYRHTSGYAHLAHGRAVLNAFYRPSNVQPRGVCDDDPDGAAGETGLRPGSVFTGRHRALTAPVVVATCDQVLAAAVSHKFSPVRLASLAGKHVILDEVHTYDPYQDRLLRRVLGWLGFYRTRVTLLTATLPTRRLRDYVQAYRAGWNGFTRGTDETDIGSTVYPSVTVTTSDGRIKQHALAAHRAYAHRLVTHRIRGGGSTAATVDLVEQERAADPAARIGVIVNRVDRAIAVAVALRRKGQSVVLLHSRMTFAQRTKATAELLAGAGKKALTGPLTVVATQLAEASLDIDLDVLFSDLAPMASLLQRMGRQWRHSTPNQDGGWTHLPARAHRSGDPVLHILVSVDDDGRLHPAAHYPYTRAEITRTWQHPETLAAGTRNLLHVPQDVQAAVDRADVSIADLHTEPGDAADPELAAALADHLTAAGAATAAGDRAGIDAETIDRGWRAAMLDGEDDSWAGVPALAELTRGRIWREEAVTRLRKTDNVQVLIYDSTGANPYAWPGDLAELLAVRDRSAQLAALDHVVPVSGSLATALRRAARPHIPDPWHPVTLLRDVIPMRIGHLPAGCQLTINGLENHQGG